MTGQGKRFAMVIVRPLPGERRKRSSLVLVERPWRSKWSTAVCMGAARGCRAGACRHAAAVAELVPRCRPAAREPEIDPTSQENR
jgi:hypothetical protein